MNDYVAETYAAVHIADLHREAAADRLAAGFPRTGRPHRWAELRTRVAAWAERPRAGRSLGVCCPA
jgi:hypothetical protein